MFAHAQPHAEQAAAHDDGHAHQRDAIGCLAKKQPAHAHGKAYLAVQKRRHHRWGGKGKGLQQQQVANAAAQTHDRHCQPDVPLGNRLPDPRNQWRSGDHGQPCGVQLRGGGAL